MKQKTADRLIDRLGMTYEMTPLLASFGEEGYQRFEQAVLRALDSYKGNRPRIRVTKRRRRVYAKTRVNYILYLEHTHPLPESDEEDGFFCYRAFQRDSAFFKRYYGIGLGEENCSAIAKIEGISRANVHLRTKRVLALLKQQHKRDIWYGTLGR